MIALALTALVACAAIAALAVVALRSRTAPGPSLAGCTLVVQTRDSQSIRGVCVADHADRITLREAVYLHPSGEQPVGGLVHVPRENYAFAQQLARPVTD